MKLFQRLRRQKVPLPDAVYRYLIGVLFSMRLPVFGMGIGFVCIAVIVAKQWHDSVAGMLAIVGGLVTVARVLTIEAFHGLKIETLDRAEIRVWEVRYAVLSFAFAALLGALNVRVLSYHSPLLHMITISLVFGFGAGIVARISVRPAICVISLLLAVVPTTVALVIHATTQSGLAFHAQLFALEAVVVGGTAALSLQTVQYLHRAIVDSVVLRHDLTLLAKQDALTGLPNRLRLRERFQESIVPVARTGRRLAVHFLDLDGFKEINDLYGHPAGDAVLQEVALRLTAIVRAEDTVARLGGDEFVVVQARISHRSEAEMLARRILRQLSVPYEADGKRMNISVSIGIAIAPDQGLDLERLTACADAALYRAKGSGKGQIYFCTAEDQARMLSAVA